MRSKEEIEIEKAKERINNLGKSIQANCKGKSNMATSIEILLQYIDQLEKSDTSKEQSSMNYYNKCKELEQENNKQNKIIDEMAKELYIEGFCMEIKCKECESEPKDCIKQYFEKKVEEKQICHK